jgi:dihydrodipicolinate synthase/N-acetylneuraminate lyase
MTEPRIAVWHRDDPRVRDNAALRAAVADGRPCPLYVFDPQFYRSGMACDARLRFVHESVSDLAAIYRDHGSDLALAHGDPSAVLDEVPVDRIYVTRSVTGRYGRRRDAALFDRPDVRVFAADGIDRTGRPREAYDWSEQAEAYFESGPIRPPGRLPDNPLERTTGVEAVETEYGIDPEKTGVPTGGATAGWARLAAFTDRLGEYPDSISPPARAERNSSRLSPYLAMGCLTPRQVYRYVHENASSGTGRELFTSRLYWNRHYTQKLADWPGWMDRAVNPVYTGLFRDRHDPDLVDAVADHPDLVGMKDTSGDLTHLLDIIRRTGDDFHLFQGFDSQLAPAVSMGATGGINAVANYLPGLIKDTIDAAAADDMERARDLQVNHIGPVFDVSLDHGFAPATKAALVERGVIDDDEVRPPLVELDGDALSAVRSVLDDTLGGVAE